VFNELAINDKNIHIPRSIETALPAAPSLLIAERLNPKNIVIISDKIKSPIAANG